MIVTKQTKTLIKELKHLNPGINVSLKLIDHNPILFIGSNMDKMLMPKNWEYLNNKYFIDKDNEKINVQELPLSKINDFSDLKRELVRLNPLVQFEWVTYPTQMLRIKRSVGISLEYPKGFCYEPRVGLCRKESNIESSMCLPIETDFNITSVYELVNGLQKLNPGVKITLQTTKEDATLIADISLDKLVLPVGFYVRENKIITNEQVDNKDSIIQMIFSRMKTYPETEIDKDVKIEKGYSYNSVKDAFDNYMVTKKIIMGNENVIAINIESKKRIDKDNPNLFNKIMFAKVWYSVSEELKKLVNNDMNSYDFAFNSLSKSLYQQAIVGCANIKQDDPYAIIKGISYCSKIIARALNLDHKEVIKVLYRNMKINNQEVGVNNSALKYMVNAIEGYNQQKTLKTLN